MEESKKISFADVRESLAGLIPMSEKSVYEFTPTIYAAIPEQFRPSFKIRQFSMSQVEEIKSLMTGSNKKAAKDDAKMTEMFITMLFNVFEGWDNLYDLGSGYLFKYDGTIDGMKLLPQQVLVKIFEEATIISGIMTRDVLQQITKTMQG